MRFKRRALGMVIAATTGALAMTLAVGAFGALGKPHSNGTNHQGNHTGAPLIDESLAPSHSTPPDPTFHGVTPGGAPWVLKRGDVRLKRDGHLDLQVKGLVIPGTGTGPVTTISASLYCGADLVTAPVDTTQTVPLSSNGNARIHDTSFTVPSTCLAPVILVHPNGILSMYIAVDGWRLP